MQKIIVAKQVEDVHTNLFFQMLVSHYMEEYDIDEHIKSIRALYKKKSSVMIEALKKNIKALTPNIDKNNASLKESNKALKDTKKLIDQLSVSKVSKRKSSNSGPAGIEAQGKELAKFAQEQGQIINDLINLLKHCIRHNFDPLQLHSLFLIHFVHTLQNNLF